MLSAQVLALTLIPLLSGGLPASGAPTIDVPVLLGLATPLSRSFMVGTWKCTDYFCRWGVTDTGRARIARFGRSAFMCLHEDGTMKMVNLFRPEQGRWKIRGRALVLYHPKHSDRGVQRIPVKTRDENRIWLLLPFASGATGIGMARVTEEQMHRAATGGRRKTPHTTTRLRQFRAPSIDDPDAPAGGIASLDKID